MSKHLIRRRAHQHKDISNEARKQNASNEGSDDGAENDHTR